MTADSYPELSVVLPAFNEEGNVEALYSELLTALEPISSSFEIVIVDDGSKDSTEAIIRKICSIDKRVVGILLSRNFGHQNALLAGLEHAKGKIIITMDADFQHPPSVIPELLEKHKEGYPIVNGRRKDAGSEYLAKKISSRWFYKIVNLLSDVSIPPGVADFRLYDRVALNQLLTLREKDRFSRGLVSWLGYDQAYVDYEVQMRKHGKTKYSLPRMMGLALSGVTSFSTRPLRLAFHIGLILSFLGLIYAVYAIVQHIRGFTVEGWTSILVSILLIGGVQLISIGILGEYLAHLFHEVKARPHYLVKETLGKTED